MAANHNSDPASTAHDRVGANSSDGKLSYGVALGRLGLVGQTGVVLGGIFAAALLIAPWSYGFGGIAGLRSVGVAAGVSLLAAELALLVGGLFRGPAAAMYGMVSGMTVRMAVALLLGVALQLGATDRADRAMIFYLLVFYMVTLAIETGLLLARVRPTVGLAKEV